MSKITFTEEQIATFTPEEREMFNTLMAKGNAQIEETENEEGFNIKLYLEKLKAKKAADEEYQRFMNDTLSGKTTTQYY